MAHGNGLYSNQPRSSTVEGISFERASPSDKAHPGLGWASEGFEGYVIIGVPWRWLETFFLQVGRQSAYHRPGFLPKGTFSLDCVLDHHFAKTQKQTHNGIVHRVGSYGHCKVLILHIKGFTFVALLAISSIAPASRFKVFQLTQSAAINLAKKSKPAIANTSIASLKHGRGSSTVHHLSIILFSTSRTEANDFRASITPTHRT